LKDLFNAGYITLIQGSGLYQKPKISIVRLDNYTADQNPTQNLIYNNSQDLLKHNEDLNIAPQKVPIMILKRYSN